jgi:hypothetical protein
MAYCRFSTDCFRCDVYAYEDVSGGWTIHVAARKRDVPADFIDPLLTLIEGFDPGDVVDAEARVKEYNRVHAILDNLPWIELASPSAGQSFREHSLEGFRDRMVKLREEGLRFPGEVFTDIDNEIASRDGLPREFF